MNTVFQKLKVIFRRLSTLILQDIAFLAPWPLRSHLHRARGAKIGEKVYIGSLVMLDDAYPEYITIEDNVQLSAGVKILTHDSSFQNTFAGLVPTYIGPVVIKHNAYIGSGALILPGVTIGERAIVGAGAVVNRNVPSATIVAGVPARVVGTIEEKLENFLSKQGMFLMKYYETPRKLTENEIQEILSQLRRHSK